MDVCFWMKCVREYYWRVLEFVCVECLVEVEEFGYYLDVCKLYCEWWEMKFYYVVFFEYGEKNGWIYVYVLMFVLVLIIKW